MDSILIKQLKIETIIGTYDWERQVKQNLVFDLELFKDIKAAASSDDLTKSIDYSAVAESVTAFVANSSFKLIETIAEKTAQLILENFALEKVNLMVTKPGCIANAKEVSICICRDKD